MPERFIEPARPGETRDDYLTRLVARAPDLRDEDRKRLADLLRPARDAAPAASTNTPINTPINAPTDTHQEAS